MKAWEDDAFLPATWPHRAVVRRAGAAAAAADAAGHRRRRRAAPFYKLPSPDRDANGCGRAEGGLGRRCPEGG